MHLASPPSENPAVSTFYNRLGWLYPLVDLFFARARLQLIERVNVLPHGRLLEIGVGPGTHLLSYRRHDITAIDCSARMVSSSRRHAPRAEVCRMDGEHLTFPDASFDYVVLCHVLSVTSQPGKMLSEVHRVLRHGGIAFVLNHETPTNGWRHLDRVIMPLARVLCFRSWFRLREIGGVERFQSRREFQATFGLVNAYSLVK